MRQKDNIKKGSDILYSYEIEDYIKKRNYSLTANECAEIINVGNNPQIARVKYNPFNNEYEINTYDGYYLKFNVN